MDFLEMLRNILNPKKVEGFFRKELKKSSWFSTILNVVLATLIIVSPFLLVTFLGLLGNNSVDFVAGIAATIIIGLIIFVLFFILGVMLYLVAKVLGGQATLGQQLYLQSIVTLALSPVAVIFSFISGIIALLHVCLFFLPPLLMGLYGLFLSFKILIVAHRLTRERAAIALVLYLVVLFVLYATLVLQIPD